MSNLEDYFFNFMSFKLRTNFIASNKTHFFDVEIVSGREFNYDEMCCACNIMSDYGLAERNPIRTKAHVNEIPIERIPVRTKIPSERTPIRTKFFVLLDRKMLSF